METIGQQQLWTFIPPSNVGRAATNKNVRAQGAHPVASFLDLAVRVAELQFSNREHMLVFRGQDKDYRVKKRSSLKPQLFRPDRGKPWNPSLPTLSDRFSMLTYAEGLLVLHYEAAGFDDLDRLKRQRILRWAILQHYSVCATPLLDVTQSLRVAASFATHDNDSDKAYVFALGVPNLSGAITASAEAGLQIVRLSSACPPSALRPHIQEGYLLGEYPDMLGVDQKSLYPAYEIDFGRRLIAKFEFHPSTFWKSQSYPLVPKEALYPDSQSDRFEAVAALIRQELGNQRF
jgi:hypothetical protein